MSDERRPLCDELAGRLATKSGLRLARLLQSAGVASSQPSDAASAERVPRSPQAADPRPISIWEPRKIDGESAFVRPEPSPLGDHYAAVRVLRQAKPRGRRRICFFGESVAAGYLYAPHLTPARVLEKRLRSVTGDDRFDVVDLARTNETLDSLVHTVESSLQLAPDLLVVFAGNNWNLLEAPERSPYYPSVTARQEYARRLRESGLLGPVEAGAYETMRRAGEAFAEIDRIARAAGVPAILIVPEVNLADWETRQPVTWLPGASATNDWHRQRDRALDLLQRAEWRSALEPVERMLDEDEGLCPTTHRLRALAAMGLEDERRAVAACRDEVASGHYASLCFLSAPQATPLIQEVTRRAATHHGFGCVDLPRIFTEHTGSPLPGRRLFLDYCHLTSEGIEVAMAATAAEALRRLGVEGRWRWREMVGSAACPISPEHEALAQLGAAVHSAHRLVAVSDKRKIVEHWCERALETSNGVEQAMLDLIEARCSPVPSVLSAAQPRNLESPFRLGYQHGWRYPYIDVAVIEAIANSLGRRGRPIRSHIQRLLVERFTGGRRTRELLNPPRFLWEPLERFFSETLTMDERPERATLRTPWPVTRIALVAAGGAGLRIDVTARVPPPRGLEAEEPENDSPIQISVNGQPVSSMSARAAWTRHSFRVEGHALREGLNELSFHWPPLIANGDKALEAAAARLDLGLEPDLHPVFGELFSVQVTD